LYGARDVECGDGTQWSTGSGVVTAIVQRNVSGRICRCPADRRSSASCSWEEAAVFSSGVISNGLCVVCSDSWAAQSRYSGLGTCYLSQLTVSDLSCRLTTQYVLRIDLGVDEEAWLGQAKGRYVSYLFSLSTASTTTKAGGDSSTSNITRTSQAHETPPEGGQRHQTQNR
jgi:hypothetical protein